MAQSGSRGMGPGMGRSNSPSSVRGTRRDRPNVVRGIEDEFRPPSLDENLVDVRIEGNETIKTPAIAKYIKSRPGRPLNKAQVQQDISSLFRTSWFMSADYIVRRPDKGLVLVFRVVEKPIVQRVEFNGNKKIKDKHLIAETGLKRGSPFDTNKNRDAARRIEEHYHQKGYTFATVELAKGGSSDHREVVFNIYEGPKPKVTSTKFEGNTIVGDAVLRTKIRTSRAFLWFFGGKYDPITREDDMAAIRKYYKDLGYFDVEVTDRVGFSENRSRVYISYDVVEGKRFKLRNVELSGNFEIPTEKLDGDLKLVAGEYFNTRFLNTDLESINQKYYDEGRLFTRVEAQPRFLEEPGVIDLVYLIDEDIPRTIRRINVHIEGDDPHTKRSVVLNQMRLAPGDLADKKLILRSETRLAGAQYFLRDPAHKPRIEVSRVDDEIELARRMRGQNVDPLRQPLYSPARDRQTHHRNLRSAPRTLELTSQRETRRKKQPITKQLKEKITDDDLPFIPSGIENPFFDMHPAVREAPEGSLTIRGQNYDNYGNFGGQGGPPFDGMYPQGDPLGGPGAVDLDVYVTEERTGRLMFGVGVNSDAGVVGSFVLSESNFDILRPPRSFGDLINGAAWRGGGQRFRLEAVPGNVVSRYMVSWTDPFFMNTDYSLGVSGFFFNRFFPDWDEQRAGGRVTIGRLLTPEWSVSGAVRLEEVEIDNPDVPTPTLLLDSLGASFLSTLRGTLAHDTRDSAFLPGAGHYMQVAYEQAVGDFSYPRLEAEARQYFTVHSRPDGGGRQTLAIGGQLAWTGDDTPIFERMYAGGFQTFRGFQFRGVGPRQLDVRVGGQWMALGSVEYLVPLMANETIQGVVFSDFGTVENDVGFNDFRLSVGAGLRVTVPAMGPVPLAFDFASPIIREDFDDTRIFSFSVGFAR